MGQIFSSGGLTQPGTALQDPNTGQSLYVGNPNQVLNQSAQVLRSALQPKDPLTADPFAQSGAQLPTIGQPSYREAASVGATPGGVNALSPGLNKAGRLITMLSAGVQGALAGRAAQEQASVQSGGRRSGGAGMGFSAGFTLPWQRAEQQAQAQLAQGAAAPVQTPYGTMPAEFASRSLLPWMVRGQAMQDVANTAAGARTGAAQIQAQGGLARQQLANQGRMDVETMIAAIAANKGAKYIPDVDPQSGQQFYRVLNPFGREIGQADVNAIPQLMQRSQNTVDWQTDQNGQFVALPKTTVSGPVLPGPRQTAGPAAAGRTGGVTAPKVATDANGQPIISNKTPAGGKWYSWDENGRTVAGPLSMARQRGAANPAEVPGQEVRDITNARHAITLATKQGNPNNPESMGVLQLVDSLDKDGKLGIASSRWNDFLTRGVGTSPDDDPRIVTLLDKGELLMTASMQAHFGASGSRSPQMLEHFLNMANAKKMDGPTLRAGFRAVTNYMQDRAMIPGQQGGTGASQANRPPLGSFEHY